MQFRNLHPWNLKPKDAIKLQKSLVSQIYTQNLRNIDPQSNLIIAAVDVSYSRIEKVGFAYVVVWDLKNKEIIEEQSAVGESLFPYVPCLLSFREAPLALEAISKIKSKIDVFMFDGQGIAHPRGIGLASHMGLFLEKPSIGCAKSRLFGTFTEPACQKDSRSFLYQNDKIIGTVLRSKRRCNPLFISVGHLIDLSTSIDIISQMIDKYRIPEPLRIADLNTKLLRKKRNL